MKATFRAIEDDNVPDDYDPVDVVEVFYDTWDTAISSVVPSGLGDSVSKIINYDMTADQLQRLAQLLGTVSVKMAYEHGVNDNGTLRDKEKETF